MPVACRCHALQSYALYIHKLLFSSFPIPFFSLFPSLKKRSWCRELHDRLRSLVGGAITRMAREKACKGQMASLESQLHLLQVWRLLHIACTVSNHSVRTV